MDKSSFSFRRPETLRRSSNFGFPSGIGPTGGVMTEGCQMYWYFGGGVMTPGMGASLTASPSSPTQGWNFGLQIALGVAGQVGYAPGPGGGLVLGSRHRRRVPNPVLCIPDGVLCLAVNHITQLPTECLKECTLTQ